MPLRELLRDGRSDAALSEALSALWCNREERGAEQRLAMGSRGPVVDLDELIADPGLEMHTRGG